MTNKSENPREKLYRKMLHGHWVKIVSVLASVVVFITTYSLILPAITLSNQEPKCNIEEHTHVAECYDAEGNIVCGSEEHVHNLACYSDLNAAIENEEYWAAELPELTGDRNADVIAVAKSQIGYKENEDNYIVSENDQMKGYTRYGHWFGDTVDTTTEKLSNGLSDYAYKDWDAMFVSFVLRYAEIYDIGFDSDAGNWAGALSDAAIYVNAADYAPQMGDLIFFTPNVGDNMRVGIVSGVNRGLFGNEIKSISVILGDSNNTVEEVKVAVSEYTEGDITFETIHGYGVLTPGYGEQEATAEPEVTEENENTDAAVAVPEETEVVVPEDESTTDVSVAEEASASLEESTGHLIGQTEESLETVDEASEGKVTVELVDVGTSEDASEIVMNWNMSTYLPEAILPAGSIIRIDTSTGKTHAMTVEQVRDWAQVAVVGAENMAYVDNESFEVTFIGDNGLLYTWDDVQNMDAATVTSFTGIHIKALNDVALGDDGAIFFGFASMAKVVDANAGQNYYVSKVTVNGVSGTETYLYTNGEAETVDQNAVLRDAGLEEMPVETSTEKTLTVKKIDYTVTMTYGPEAGIPDGAKLYVQEIRQGTEEYNRYIDEAKAALGISEEDAAELLGRFFDIKIMTKEGEFEPKAPVNVNIEYKKAVETEDVSNVSAVHFSKNGAESIPVETVEVSETEDEMAKVKSVEFCADSFSVYGVVYTVDFEYTDPITGQTYYYSIEGGTSIDLTELLVVLGIKTEDNVEEFVANNVENVEFSNPELVKVTHKEKTLGIFGGEDWVLESLEAFDTEETLTIILKNGEQIVIQVTDAQTITDLNQLTLDVSVSNSNGEAVVENPDGSITVNAESKYNFAVKFKETSDLQYNNQADLIYTVPEGVVLDNASGTFAIRIGRRMVNGNTYTVFTDTDGKQKVKIELNQDDLNFRYLNTSADVEMDLTFSGKFSNTATSIAWGGSTTPVPVIVKQKVSDGSVTKTGEYKDGDSPYIEYTVAVTASGGPLENVVVADSVSGNALTFSGITYVSDSNNRTLTENTDYSITSSSGDGFNMTINSVPENTTVYVHYKADVSITSIAKSAKATFDETGNIVRITAPGDENPNNDEDSYYEPNVNFSSLSKVATSVGSTIEDGGHKYKIITWKLTANTEKKVSLNNSAIVDRLLNGDDVDYYGSGITVSMDGGAGVLVPWSQVGLTVNGDSTISGDSWSYDVTDSGNHSYEITYQTKVDITNWPENSSKDIVNAASDKYNEDTGRVTITNEVEKNEPKITKNATSVGENTITWKINVSVPANFEGPLVVSDIYPWSSDGAYADSLADTVQNSITVDGMTPVSGPTETTILVNDRPKNGFVVDFGRITKSNENRNITITVVTKNNKDWMDAAEDPNYAWLSYHVNTAKAGTTAGDGTYGEDTDNPQPSRTKISKNRGNYNESETVYNNVYGGEIPVFGFRISLQGVTEDNVSIDEIFDESLFQMYTPAYGGNLPDHLTVGYGEDAYNREGANSGGAESVVYENGKIKLNGLKRTDGNAYWGYYNVYFHLALKCDPTNKDSIEAALDRLKKYVADNGNVIEKDGNITGKKYTFINQAKYNDIPAEAPFSYTVDNIIKKTGTDNNDGTYTYNITLNPEKVMINHGAQYNLQDVFSGIKVQKNSIQIQAEGKNASDVPNRIFYSTTEAVAFIDSNENYEGVIAVYDESSETIMTVYIPDETKVIITYIADSKGEVTVNTEEKEAVEEVSNTATALDYSYTVNFTHKYDIISKTKEDNGDGSITFTIDFNPSKLKLNGGNDIELTDTFTGDLEIDGTSFNVTACDPDESGTVANGILNSKDSSESNTYKFTVPDSTHVTITYTGTPKYHVDAQGNITSEYSNTAEGVNVPDTITDSKNSKILEKDGEEITDSADPNYGSIRFSITFNPTGLTLNEGQDIELKDDFTNLIVNYSTVAITPNTYPEWHDKNGEKIVYDYSGYTGTFIVPDKTPVTITYIAAPDFGKGDSIEWYNDVSAKGYRDRAEGTSDLDSSGIGFGSLGNVLWLLKYETGHMERPMNGVTFKLYMDDGSGNKIPVTRADDETEQLTFETGYDPHYGDGYVQMTLENAKTEFTDGTNGFKQDVIYFLEEVPEYEGSENFYANTTTYNFVIHPATKEIDDPENPGQKITVSNDPYKKPSYMEGIRIYDFVQDDIVKITNDRITKDVSIQKNWVNGDGTWSWPEGINKVTVKIQQMIGDSGEWKDISQANNNIPSAYINSISGELQPAADGSTWSSTIDLTEAKSKAQWSNLDLEKDEQNISYRTVEVSVNGIEITDGKVTVNDKTYEVLGGEVKNGKATITNAEVTDINFEKKWQNIPSTITYKFPTGTTANTSAGAGHYTVPGVVGDVYAPTATGNDTDGYTMNIPFDRLRIRIQLHRYVSKGGDLVLQDFDLSDPNSPDYKYGKEYDLYGYRGTFGNDTDYFEYLDPPYWGAEWKNLPTAYLDDNGAEIDYVYKVEEKMVTISRNDSGDSSPFINVGGEGYYDLSDLFDAVEGGNGNNLTITNTMKDDDNWYLNVKKQWKDYQGKVITTGEPVEFQLLRSGSRTSIVPSGSSSETTTLTGASSDAWGQPINASNEEVLENIGHDKKLIVTAWTTNNSTHTGLKLIIRDSSYVTKWQSGAIISENEHIFEVPVKDLEPTGTIAFEGMTGSNDFTWNVSYAIVPNTSTTEEELSEQVMMPDPNNPGNYIVDTTGQYKFTIDPNQTISFVNLPYNVATGPNETESYEYTIVETSTGANWEVEVQSGNYSPAPDDGESSGKSGEVLLVNKYTAPLTGSLKITKSVTVDNQPIDFNNATSAQKKLVDGTYTFEIWNSDATTQVTTKDNGDAIGTLQVVVTDGVPTPAEIIVNGLTPGAYVIKETGSDNEHVSMVTEGVTGYDSTKGGIVVNVSAGDTSGVATAAFTNNYDNTNFEFTKEWHNQSDQVVDTWGGDITVTVFRRIGTGDGEILGKYTIHKGDSAFEYTKDSSTSSAPDLENVSGFTFKISDLPKKGKIGNDSGDYIYYVTEEQITDYREPTYSNPTVTTPVAWTPSTEQALNGGKIINRPVESYALPETGGFGTMPFYMIGIMLIALAVSIYGLLHRRHLVSICLSHGSVAERRSKQKRGGDGL